MTIRPGDYYVICADCGLKKYKSDTKYDSVAKSWICRSHINIKKEQEYKQYKVDLAYPPRFTNKHSTVFREQPHTWDFCHYLWEDDDGNWEDN